MSVPDTRAGSGARPPVPALLAVPASRLYGAVMARRNRRFDAGRGVIEFDRPTISIGNLSVGGTGKTPMVMHAVRVLGAAGLSPCIAMRGYRAHGGESDEAGEYARGLPGVPVVARADRVEALIGLFGSEAGQRTDAIVLDDGFQHRRIARDLDIVLIDSTRDPFADALLPRGWLREPVTSLTRAGAVVITHAEAVPPSIIDEIERGVRRINPNATIAVCEHAWGALGVVDAAGEREEPAGWLRGKPVVVACAIGNPGAFVAQVRGAGGRDPAGAVVLRDHDPFDASTVARIIENARETRAAAVIVTEKDWSKLRRVPAERWPCPVVRARLELRFRRGEDALSALMVSVCRARPYVPVEEFLGGDEAEPAPSA